MIATEELPAPAGEAQISMRELARHFRVSERTIRTLTKEGKIPCYRLGGKIYRYKISEVEQSLARKV